MRAGDEKLIFNQYWPYRLHFVIVSVFGKVRRGNSDKNFKLSPPQTGSTHDAYAVGYSCYPLSNMTQQSSPNTHFFIAGDGNGRLIQKSADGAIPTIAYRVRVQLAIPPRYIHAYEDCEDSICQLIYTMYTV